MSLSFSLFLCSFYPQDLLFSLSNIIATPGILPNTCSTTFASTLYDFKKQSIMHTPPPPASSIHNSSTDPAHAHYVNTLGCFTAVIKEYPLANHYQTIQVPCVDLKINLISLYFVLRVYVCMYVCM